MEPFCATTEFAEVSFNAMTGADDEQKISSAGKEKMPGQDKQ